MLVDRSVRLVEYPTIYRLFSKASQAPKLAGFLFTINNTVKGNSDVFMYVEDPSKWPQKGEEI